MGQKSKKATASVMTNQQTLKNQIKCTGIGLHSVLRVTMMLLPAEVNQGIVFRRTDLTNGAREIAARYDRAADLMLCTSVRNDANARVATIEHLMAAFAGCGIDNATVELDGPEVPVMDGSSAPFVFLIECAGVVEQNAPRRFIEILKPVEVRDGDRAASLSPAGKFSLSFNIDFDSELVGEQSCFFEMRDGSFKAELSRARTFGFAGDVEKLHALGLALGGSLENAVVVSGDRVLNEGGQR